MSGDGPAVPALRTTRRARAVAPTRVSWVFGPGFFFKDES